MLIRNEPEVDCFGEILRSEASLQSALEALSDPWERIQHRLLWFHGPVCLDSGACAGPFPRLNSAELAHENALRGLVAAYRCEDLDRMVAALRAWHALLRQPEYWEYLAESESHGQFAPAASAAALETLRENAMALAAEPLAAAAGRAWAQQALPLFRDYLAAVQQLEELGPWAAACREDLLFPLSRDYLPREQEAPLHRNDRLSSGAEVKTLRIEVSPANEAKPAEDPVAEETIYRVRQQCRRLVDWGGRVYEEEGHTDRNRLVAKQELLLFRSQISPGLQQLARLLDASDRRTSALRGEAARFLSEIAIHYSWAGEPATAELLIDEALRLAEGTAAVTAIRESYQSRRCGEPAVGDQLPLSRTPRPISPQGDELDESFPAKLPFASDRWRVVAAVTVLVVLVVACFAGSDGSVSAPTKPPTVNAPTKIEPASYNDVKNANAAAAGDDPVVLKLRVLLMQIDAEERTARQLERQLTPLQRELASRRTPGTGPVQTSHGKQSVHAQDRLAAGHDSSGSSKSSKESE